MDTANKKGLFIVFEGIDGSGKSTQARKLHNWLENQGKESLLTCEPTNGKTGKQIRDILAKGGASKEELCSLFVKDRKEHIEEFILPNLRKGVHVICDRYFYSNIAYQGASGMNAEGIKEQNGFALTPGFTFYIDVDAKTALERVHVRNEEISIFEKKEFLEKVREKYEAMNFPNFAKVNGNRDEDEIFREIISLFACID